MLKANTKKYLSNEYRCEESGLTDVAFEDFGELLAQNSEGRIQEILSYFKEAGIGETSETIREYIEDHISKCVLCKKQYEQLTPTTERAIKLIYTSLKKDK